MFQRIFFSCWLSFIESVVLTSRRTIPKVQILEHGASVKIGCIEHCELGYEGWKLSWICGITPMPQLLVFHPILANYVRWFPVCIYIWYIISLPCILHYTNSFVKDNLKHTRHITPFCFCPWPGPWTVMFHLNGMEVSLVWQRTQLIWTDGWSENLIFKYCKMKV